MTQLTQRFLPRPTPGLLPLDFFGRDERSIDTARMALQGRSGGCPVCTENSNTHVVMVKPAEDRI